ncbi:MAG: UDP-2,4-diacetamido-2,4,6-trideoxy-beta-L-altropyranose hydrolase [Magnetococcales bacterium]|nr:UDP-2,4-diacetamido-2,4,6-trideoxy-beta-L-altropyranose hydrolase [Magnetococcales bacterium]
MMKKTGSWRRPCITSGTGHPDMPTALLRFDASPTIGGGHAMRCLTLANALHAGGWSCVLWTNEEAPQLLPQLVQGPHAWSSCLPGRGTPYAWAIVDHYQLDAHFERSLRRHADRILVLDDLANRPHDCDLLLDQTLGRPSSDYQPWVPPSCTLLTGSDHALLRPQFSNWRWQALQRQRPQPHQAWRILVSLGAGDSGDLLPRVVEGLALAAQALSLPLEVTVIAATTVRLEQNHPFLTIRHQSAVTDMAPLMAESDLAIGAAGSTAWERCCLSLPTLALELADNQHAVITALAQQGALLSLGRSDRMQPEQLSLAVMTLIRDRDQWTAMSQQAARLCDGMGTARLLDHLDPIYSHEGRPVRLSRASLSDTDTILSWQQHPDTRRWARNPQPPTATEHRHWMERHVDDPNCLLHLIVHGEHEQPVGVLRLDFIDPAFEVSILIDPHHYRLGLGHAALRLARRLLPQATLQAEILTDNKASQALFSQAGYQRISETIWQSDWQSDWQSGGTTSSVTPAPTP